MKTLFTAPTQELISRLIRAEFDYINLDDWNGEDKAMELIEAAREIRFNDLAAEMESDLESALD